MKKLLILLLLAVSVAAQGQSTRVVTGVVIDKNGNPVPEAMIEATGGTESTMSGPDGTFKIVVSKWLESLTCTHPTMGTKKVKIEKKYGEVIFKMNGNVSDIRLVEKLGLKKLFKKDEKKKKKKNIVTNGETTIILKGAVVDKNGNAIPGATIEATGGAENTMSGPDGTFTLEVSRWLKSITVSYEGKHEKKIKVDPEEEELVIRLNVNLRKD